VKNKSALLLTVGLSLALAAGWLLTFSGFSISGVRAASLTVCSTGCDYSVIQDAVDAAGEGDVIKVAAGTYDDVNNYNGLAQVVYINKTVTIRGGYTTAFTEPPDPVANPTTLDAGGLGRVIYVEGNINPTIEGLRITGGDTTSIGNSEGGGGVKIVGSAAILRNNYIFNNTAGSGGGADLSDCAVTLEGNTIISNTASGGGGIWMWQCDNSSISGNTISFNTAYTQSGGLWAGGGTENIIIEDNTFSSNHSGGWSGGLELQGNGYSFMGNTVISNTAPGLGGIFLLSGDFKLIDNNVIANSDGVNIWNCENVTLLGNNISYNDGSGISSSGDNILISGNTISHNAAEGGGGVSLSGNHITLIGNNISNNDSVRNGGGVRVHAENDIKIIGNTIISNTAGWGGGGINLIGATNSLYVSGNTIANNIANEGGGVSLDGDAELINNLIVDNQGINCCGNGVRVAGPYSVRLLHNTIARNTGAGGAGLWVGDSSSVVVTNTMIVSHTVGLEVNPGGTATLEATLWGDGFWANGSDWTGGGTINHTNDYWGNPDFVDYLAGDYHIGENSDAIDAGIEAGVTTDIDFHPRPYQIPDIGADEYWPPGALKFIYLPLVLR